MRSPGAPRPPGARPRAASLLGACLDGPGPAPPDARAPSHERAAAAPPFVALYPDERGDARPAGGPDVGGVEKANKSFYLAVRKDALDERWFLSADLKQYHPEGGGHSIGTRVVSFRAQNGKLFVFDADEVLDYVRAAETPERRLAAWQALFAPLRAPLSPPTTCRPRSTASRPCCSTGSSSRSP